MNKTQPGCVIFRRKFYFYFIALFINLSVLIIKIVVSKKKKTSNVPIFMFCFNKYIRLITETV